jgi:hypothetical protein
MHSATLSSAYRRRPAGLARPRFGPTAQARQHRAGITRMIARHLFDCAGTESRSLRFANNPGPRRCAAALSRMLRGGYNKMRCGSPAMIFIDSTTCGAFGGGRYRQRVSGRYPLAPLTRGSPMHRDPATLRGSHVHRSAMPPTVRPLAF